MVPAGVEVMGRPNTALTISPLARSQLRSIVRSRIPAAFVGAARAQIVLPPTERWPGAAGLVLRWSVAPALSATRHRRAARGTSCGPADRAAIAMNR